MSHPLKKYRLFDAELEKELDLSLKPKNRALIRLFIKDEQIIYSNYASSERPRINEEIISYLKEEAKYIPLKTKIFVEVEAKSKNIEIAQKVQNMLQVKITEKIKGINKELKRQLKIIYILAIMGIIFLALLFISENLGRFGMTELLSIISWVFIWRAVEIYFFERKNSEFEKFKWMQLYFSTFKPYSENTENI